MTDNLKNTKYSQHDIFSVKIQCILSGLSYKESLKILKKVKKDLKLVSLNQLKPDSHIEIIPFIEKNLIK